MLRLRLVNLWTKAHALRAGKVIHVVNIAAVNRWEVVAGIDVKR
jgi:hypothetical protein